MTTEQQPREIHRENANGSLGCLRPLISDNPDEPVCGCHITEKHAFVSGPRRMSTCFTCGRGGSAKIHKAV